MDDYTTGTTGFASDDFNMDVLLETMKKTKPVENPVYMMDMKQFGVFKASMPKIEIGDEAFDASSIQIRTMMDYGVINNPCMPFVKFSDPVPSAPVREPIPYGSSVGIWVTLFAIVATVIFMAIS